VRAQSVPGMRVDAPPAGITPLLLVVFPASCLNACFFMGIRQQRSFTGWLPGLGPWDTVDSPDGKLYGRAARMTAKQSSVR